MMADWWIGFHLIWSWTQKTKGESPLVREQYCRQGVTGTGCSVTDVEIV